MSQLLRIVLIHTHLPGVVELQLDEHTNICGTNASGKTTLQRLVPVFFGEQPNRVVPKTRKKFDEFYLPFSNSYIVYEYQRENGDICQVILTRKNDGGVDYRFINAPYHSDQYLQHTAEGVKGHSYNDWAAAMRSLADVRAISGEEERYSHLDLNGFAANLEAARKVFELLRPLLSKGNGPLLEQIDRSATALDAELDSLRLKDGYRHYDSVDPDRRKRIADQARTLADALDAIDPALGLSGL